eukprot:803652-Pelagomonas_calceolata.AAC.7
MLVEAAALQLAGQSIKAHDMLLPQSLPQHAGHAPTLQACMAASIGSATRASKDIKADNAKIMITWARRPCFHYT